MGNILRGKLTRTKDTEEIGSHLKNIRDEIQTLSKQLKGLYDRLDEIEDKIELQKYETDFSK